MPRNVVSRDSLQTWLTSELRRFEGCEECTFGGILALAQPDEAGCNWSNSIVLSTAGVPKEVYLHAVRTVMVRAREEFNIE